jgi:hypothetical protein
MQTRYSYKISLLLEKVVMVFKVLFTIKSVSLVPLIFVIGSLNFSPGALSLGIKQQEHEAGHSPPFSPKVKECVELYLHSPSMTQWHGAELKNAQEQLYLTFVY